MIRHNYHTHTKRCGHATGEDEEYVLAAIQAGVKTLGFSDHAPYDLPHPSERMDITQVQEYFDSVHALQKKYNAIQPNGIFCLSGEKTQTTVS